MAQLCTVGQPGGTMGNVSSVDAITCTQGSGSLLYAFGSQSGDGSHPTGGLLEPGDGLLLGSTLNGAAGFGSIFEYQVGGSGSGIQLLHVFEGPPDDGAAPLYPPGPMAAQAGTYIGVTTEGGASNDGAIYTMLASNGATTLAASFIANSSGAGPNSPLLELNGSYFGTTYTGGSGQAGTYFGTTWSGGSTNTGTMFQYQPQRGFAMLDDFGTASTVLRHPFGSMVQSIVNQGIYGVTEGYLLAANLTPAGALGGVYMFQPDGNGLGTVCLFGQEPGSPLDPVGGLVQAADGLIYGLSTYGGSHGLGTLYEVIPSNDTCQVLHNFTGSQADGGNPLGRPLIGSDGDFYIQTQSGAVNGAGGVVVLSPGGAVLGTLYSFSWDGPQDPSGSLVEGPGGSLYGTTTEGTSNGLTFGTIFRIG